MLQNHDSIASKSYTSHPVPRDLIPSTHESKAQILWVGCSDSWITETQTLDVMAEETFVHRNLGNVMSNGDLSSESAIVYAVDLLKVKHIIVCGHYDCGLIRASTIEPHAIHGWYEDLSSLRTANDALLSGAPQETRDRHLVEVYVLAECDWLRQHPAVKKAIEERGLKVHAFVFDKKKEATVRLLENPETEIEIKSPGKSAAKVNGERKCDGDCGGKGLCKEREAKEKEYAF